MKTHAPQADAASVAAACAELEASKLPATLMVDFSHANSSKQHKKQIEVAKENTLTTVSQFESSQFRMILIIVGAVLLSMLASWLIIRAITRPIAQVRDAISKMAEGDLAVSIVDDGRKDEAGQMIRATVAVASTLKAVLSDLRELIEAAQSGTLSVRAEPSRHKGEFASLVAGANSLLETLAQPLNEVAHVMASSRATCAGA